MTTPRQSAKEKLHDGAAGPARRLTLRWDHGRWSIVREQRIDRITLMAPSRLPEARADKGIEGFWIELLTSNGTVRYRRVLRDPTEQFICVPREDRDFTRLPVERRDATLRVLVPELPGANELHIYGTQHSPDERRDRTDRLAVLRLRGGRGRS